MKKILCLFLMMNFLSSQEPFLEEGNQLISANELGDFGSGIAEFSPAPLIDEKDPFLSIKSSKKNALYFLLPIGSITHFFLPGVSFRHSLNKNFLEVSYFNAKQADIELIKYSSFFDVESRSKIGEIYENVLNASYGFKWNTRFLDPYISLGGGLYLPYMKENGVTSSAILPAISTALGVAFKYGFFDLAVNYLPMRWTTQYAYESEREQWSSKYEVRLLANFRLGLGLPF